MPDSVFIALLAIAWVGYCRTQYALARAERRMERSNRASRNWAALYEEAKNG